MQHIEEFTSKDVLETMEELSAASDAKELHQTVAIAQELREKIAALETASVIEVTGEIMEELQVAKADLVHQLQTALTVLQECVMSTTQEVHPSVSAEALQKVLEVVIHLQDDLVDAACAVNEIKFLPGEYLMYFLPERSLWAICYLQMIKLQEYKRW